MLHLRVPKIETQAVVDFVRSQPWASSGWRVLDAGDFTLVPLGEDPQEPLPPELSKFELVLAEQPERTLHKWMDHLPNLVGEDVVEELKGHWPNAQERLGDILLVKLSREIEDYDEQIAIAKLLHQPKLRAIFRDHGVTGHFRLRKLEPLALFFEGKPLGKSAFNTIPQDNLKQLLSTNVEVREHGIKIKVNPSKSYFSHRLQNERRHTVESCKNLREKLGRPLDVVDPYCGVGPAIKHLLTEEDLIGGFIASDLNPSAMEELSYNLGLSSQPEGCTDDLVHIAESRLIGVKDAITLANEPKFKHSFDVLLVNIPHDTVDHIPSLLPLLRHNSPSLVRGWVISSDTDFEETEKTLNSHFSNFIDFTEQIVLERRRQYSSTEWLCRFEVWINQ